MKTSRCAPVAGVAEVAMGLGRRARWGPCDLDCQRDGGVLKRGGMLQQAQRKTTMDTAAGEHGRGTRTRRVAHRRDLTYQFPVYRWLSWLMVTGFAIGLGVMYLVAGMFGIPAPLGWAALVVMFCAGIALLERPKMLLTAMMFYFLLMPSNRLFGLLGLPLPGFLDELFFIPFLAVIVMSCIQRSDVPSGRWFPVAFVAVAVLGWYVNGKPSVFGVVRVTLVMLKFWIIWYYCRLTCVFRDVDHFWKWGRLYIYYAAVQFLYNCLWQRAPWPTRHWDHSGGVFGPDGTGAAHFVGYISVLALFLLVAWFGSEGRRATVRKKWWMGFLGIVIAYDFVFMTDTKHALLMMPVALLLVLFHPSVSLKWKMGVATTGLVVGLGTAAYWSVVVGRFDPVRQLMVMADSPKGEAYMAVTKDFAYLVPYPVFGAAPGRFFSEQAITSGAPLARRYVTPYSDEMARSKLAGGGTRTGGSLLASPTADMLTLMGEFGWLGTALYLVFLGWVLWALLRKASRAPSESGVNLLYLAMAGGTVFLSMTMLFAATCTVQCVMFPWWMLIGCLWDMPYRKDKPGEVQTELPADGFPSLPGNPAESLP